MCLGLVVGCCGSVGIGNPFGGIYPVGIVAIGNIYCIGVGIKLILAFDVVGVIVDIGCIDRFGKFILRSVYLNEFIMSCIGIYIHQLYTKLLAKYAGVDDVKLLPLLPLIDAFGVAPAVDLDELLFNDTLVLPPAAADDGLDAAFLCLLRDGPCGDEIVPDYIVYLQKFTENA